MKRNIKNYTGIKSIFIQLWIGIISICLVSSCEKFVTVDMPDSQLTGTTVFNDATTAKSALAHIYIQLRDKVLVTGDISTGLSVLLGNYTDEISYYSSNHLPEEFFFQNQLIPTNTTISTIWNDSYNLIFAANSVIKGVEESTGISDINKAPLKGEAIFVRAYIHFYLLNLFGEIPYVLSTDYRINTTISKMPKNKVYEAIITDLKLARDLLSDTYPSTEKVRPNRAVVKAMLARVYLYTENWQEAEKEAADVINNTSLYTWEDNLDNVFKNTSKGTLWQLIPTDKGLNTIEAQSFIFTSGPPSNRALREELVAAFETGDLRKTKWIGNVTSGSRVWYFPNKYKLNSSTASSQEYSILFRLEEQYLIRAEARAKQNNLVGAKEDLNKIRNRAGLSNTTANTQTALLQAILQERRVELFTEQGHRFFDLKRTGNADVALSSIKPGWNSTDILWPLPEKELLINPNLLPQNPGYN